MTGFALPLLVIAACYAWARFAKASASERQGTMRTLMWGGGLLMLVFMAVRSGQLLLAAVLSLVLVGLRVLPELAAAKRSSQTRSADASAPSRRMSRVEALRVLDLAETADEEEVNARYRSLMKAVHPDRGGSAYLAAQLNAAREVLLNPANSDRHRS